MDGDERRRLGEIAAANNAEWCAAVWRSHGLDVERGEGLWFCRSETPRFYPNVVTVDLNADPERQAGFIRELSQGADFEFDVKDSFACLPLAEARFKPSFRHFGYREASPTLRLAGPSTSGDESRKDSFSLGRRPGPAMTRRPEAFSASRYWKTPG